MKYFSQNILAVSFLAASFSYAPHAMASHQASKDEVVKWVVSQMSEWSPPGKSLFPDAKESVEEATARYGLIADDAAHVAFDPAEPPLFKGPNGRYKTLALLLAVADSESGFRKDVDVGKGNYSKGDSGQSWCLEQVRLGVATKGKTHTRISLVDGGGIKYVYDGTGYGGEDLVSDRKKCFRVALHIMRVSFDTCSGLDVEKRLSLYASGSCSLGWEASSRRIKKAVKWLSISPPPSDDESAVKVWYPKPSKT